MSKTTLKFLLVPAVANFYDQTQLSSLAAALHDLGHDVHTLLGPIKDSMLAKVCHEYSFDVILRVNRARPVHPRLPKGVRHISWFQDFHYDTERIELRNIQQGDILYFLGEPSVQGLRMKPSCLIDVLYPGVDTAFNTGFFPVEPKVDISLCGFIPPPRQLQKLRMGSRLASLPPLVNLTMAPLFHLLSMSYTWVNPQRSRSLQEKLLNAYQTCVELIYEPLTGHLDVHKLHDALHKVAISELAPFWGIETICRDDFRFFSMDYPRMLDRLSLIRRCTAITSSILLYGPGWDSHAEFRRFFRGIINNPRQLYIAYRSAKLNLANNTHGLGINSRTLECMHAGGVIMAHSSPHDHKRGGMLSKFEPGKHFIQYEQDNVEEVLSKWLTDNAARAAIAERAREIVIADHTWRHRALQIISDLAGATIIQHVPSIVQSAALPVGSAR